VKWCRTIYVTEFFTILMHLGIDMANPLEAHIAYETDDRVLAILTNGVGNENTSPIVNERCRILITD